MINFDTFQKAGQDSMDMAMSNFGALSKNLQAISMEMTDYSRKSFEEGSAAFEQMLAAKSVDKALEVQTAYAKSAYESFVGQANKIGEIYADMAKDAYKPFETAVSKVSK